MTSLQSNHQKLPWCEPWDLLQNWPSDIPLLFLGGSGRFAMLATDFFKTDPGELFRSSLTAGPEQSGPGPFRSGYWGLLSYDMFCEEAFRKTPAMPPVVYRVNRVLIFDQDLKTMTLAAHGKLTEVPPSGETHWKITGEKIEALLSTSPIIPDSFSGISLRPLTHDEEYLRICREAIRDIRQGRFCQINLIRYYELCHPVSRTGLVQRLQKFGGPFSALWQFEDQCLASVSPERFIKILPVAGVLQAHTYPIKGTIGRSADPEMDARLSEELLRSKKDLAELHIIVDLMRSDLNRVSVRGTVKVLSPGDLRSFANVHHLQAHISSELRKQLSLKEFLQSLCPGGSITGAPRREVMRAIFAYEKRNRGYFMGNIFTLDDSGAFDSSILIRTLYGQRIAGSENFSLCYAAGSGVTLNSNPANELQEIATKCRSITAKM